MNIFRCRRRSAFGFTIIAITSSSASFFSYQNLLAMVGLSKAPSNEVNADATGWMWHQSDIFNNATTTAKAKQRLGRIPNFLLAGAQKAGKISNENCRSSGVGWDSCQYPLLLTIGRNYNDLTRRTF
jgi:hypothetical protein